MMETGGNLAFTSEILCSSRLGSGITIWDGVDLLSFVITSRARCDL